MRMTHSFQNTSLSIRGNGFRPGQVLPDDVIPGTPGNDTLTGGSGDDKITGNAGNDKLYGRDGNDQLAGNDGNDSLWGELGADALRGGNGNDELDGGAGSDTVRGDAGDDRVYDTDTEADTLDGGAGIDVLQADWHTITDAIQWFNNPNQTQVVNGNQISGFERLSIIAGSGDDVISNAGRSTDDNMSGGDGDDLLIGGKGLDYLAGGAGHDTLVGAGKGGLYGNDGDDLLDATRSTSWHNMFGDNGNDTVLGGNGAESVYAGDGDDLVFTGGGDDYIDMGSGHNTIDGGSGIDKMSVFWDGNEDIVWTIDPTQVTEILGSRVSNVEKVWGYMGAGDDYVSNALNDYDFEMEGREGNDTLIGGGGADGLSGYEGNDSLVGGAGADSLTDYEGNDYLQGGDGNDVLSGGVGIDTLLGEAGNDRFWMGAGDSMIGGSGADTFMQTTFDASQLTDFTSGSDVIEIWQRLNVRIGDTDNIIENATTIASPGGFSTAAELVIATQDIAGAITEESAAAAIGSATSAYGIATRLFVVDNGTDSAVFYFASVDGNAAVSADELTLLVDLQGTASMGTADFVFTS